MRTACGPATTSYHFGIDLRAITPTSAKVRVTRTTSSQYLMVLSIRSNESSAIPMRRMTKAQVTGFNAPLTHSFDLRLAFGTAAILKRAGIGIPPMIGSTRQMLAPDAITTLVTVFWILFYVLVLYWFYRIFRRMEKTLQEIKKALENKTAT